jgi:hypothetical protein
MTRDELTPRTQLIVARIAVDAERISLRENSIFKFVSYVTFLFSRAHARPRPLQ